MQEKSGFFTDNAYGVSAAMIFGSANAQTLAFAERFRARFRHDPSWMSVAGYDAARLAVAAVRAVMSNADANRDTRAQRAPPR